MGNFNRLGQGLQPAQPLLANPQQLFTPARPRLSQVSSMLGAQDQVQLAPQRPGSAPLPVLHPLFGQRPAVPVLSGLGTGISGMAPQQARIQQQIVATGLQEWKTGVRETSSNRSSRINQYAANAKFGPGYEWCGFFTAWNYSSAGFKYPENFASYQKARDFFLYRSFTSRDPGLHRQLDQLRLSQQASGSSRQYFIMQESPTYDYVRDHSKYYGHVNLAAMTHSWQSLPIQPGDVALFSHGHVGLVVSYDRASGRLETVEGNTSGTGPDGKFRSQAVVRKSYDLSNPADRKKFDGFGRAALGDFE